MPFGIYTIILSTVLCKSFDHFNFWFQIYFSSCHVNMSFTIETEQEQNNKISFLDGNVIFEQGNL